MPGKGGIFLIQIDSSTGTGTGTLIRKESNTPNQLTELVMGGMFEFLDLV
jgi:hypothetical protein